MSDVFSVLLLTWFREHGRHDLPWQHPKTPYRVWVSEIMLQQTQVRTVIPYFLRFMATFPTVELLARADEDSVLALWAGLGYYSRARNLHHAAQKILSTFKGVFPNTINDLVSLPGIGQSTAAAIYSLAYNKPAAILDGNVARVLSRCFLVEGIATSSAVKEKLWALATQCLPKNSAAEYTQAIMDLGATCCTRTKPNCDQCPLQPICGAYKTQQVALYPAKKPKKQLPLRHARCIIFYANGHVYLEKRPASGIWGGLWCTPLLSDDERLNTIKDTFEMASSVMSLKHVFTHFQLMIDVHIVPFNKQVSLESGRWFNQDALKEIGVPKPIEKILACFWGKSLLNRRLGLGPT